MGLTISMAGSSIKRSTIWISANAPTTRSSMPRQDVFNNYLFLSTKTTLHPSSFSFTSDSEITLAARAPPYDAPRMRMVLYSDEGYTGGCWMDVDRSSDLV
jgi:hypothetical protein